MSRITFGSLEVANDVIQTFHNRYRTILECLSVAIKGFPQEKLQHKGVVPSNLQYGGVEGSSRCLL